VLLGLAEPISRSPSARNGRGGAGCRGFGLLPVGHERTLLARVAPSSSLAPAPLGARLSRRAMVTTWRSSSPSSTTCTSSGGAPSASRRSCA
jgi:hypothetical protein